MPFCYSTQPWASSSQVGCSSMEICIEKDRSLRTDEKQAWSKADPCLKVCLELLSTLFFFFFSVYCYFSGYISESRAEQNQTLSWMITSRCLCLVHFSEVMFITEGTWAVLSLQTCTITVQGFRLMGSSWKDAELNWLASEATFSRIYFLEKSHFIYDIPGTSV